MRRLAITAFCAIALLSGCSKEVGPRVVAGAWPPHISVPCPGKDFDTGEWPGLDGHPQTIFFHTDGRCKFTKVWFEQKSDHFSDPVIDPKDGRTASSTYDGRPIPPKFKFYYDNDFKLDGNGIGIIK